MINIKQALDWALKTLSELDSKLEDTYALLTAVINKDKAYFYSHPEATITEKQWHIFESYIKRRLQHEPVAYITGFKEFWSLSLQVTPDTLIPRPDTELLVETCLELTHAKHALVIDLGTGSGAVSLALAHERPNWQIIATDLSEKALLVAKANAKRLKSAIAFYQSDWLQHLTPCLADVIVTNPPYIEEFDAHLSRGDLLYEPKSALSSGPDGLTAIDTIIKQAPAFLKPNGWLLIEHGYQQADKVSDLLKQQNFQDIQTWKDIQGHPRVTGGHKLSV